MRRVTKVANAGKVAFAREQRKNATVGENTLWNDLKDKKLGYRIRRQHPIGDYILDFYCDAARLAIEVDGPQHAEQIRYNTVRDEVLEHRGIFTLRISSDALDDNLINTIRYIKSVIIKRIISFDK